MARIEHGESQLAEDWDGVTKVVMRNIPNRCTRAEVIRNLEVCGFGNGRGDLEHFRMPWRATESANLGFAVLEFRSSDAALAFRDAFTGFCFPDRASNKRVVVHPWRFSEQDLTRASDEKYRAKIPPRSWEVPATCLHACSSNTKVGAWAAALAGTAWFCRLGSGPKPLDVSALPPAATFGLLDGRQILGSETMSRKFALASKGAAPPSCLSPLAVQPRQPLSACQGWPHFMPLPGWIEDSHEDLAEMSGSSGREGDSQWANLGVQDVRSPSAAVLLRVSL